jgi:hypothetical protein
MRPGQCGTGRPGSELSPGDRAEVERFGAWLQSGAPEHLRAIRNIMSGKTQRALPAGLPFHIGDFVKVVDGGDQQGRVGRVVEVHDYREHHIVGIDNAARFLSFLVMVQLVARDHRTRRATFSPPGPVPFEPHELEPLFDGAGDWTTGYGRVVPERFWPVARDGFGA